jgi:hypothetical protein
MGARLQRLEQPPLEQELLLLRLLQSVVERGFVQGLVRDFDGVRVGRGCTVSL